MKKRTFLSFVIALICFFVFLFFPNKLLEKQISDEQVNRAKTEMNPLVYQGSLMQSCMLKQPNMMPIFGSSELVRFDPFHPYNYTKAKETPYDTYLIGRGGTQSIIHFLNIAEQGENLKGKKVIFIISPQWFTNKGIDEHHFSPNYSMLQAYDLAFNKTMDKKLKVKAMKRLLTFDEISRDPVLRTMYESEISTHKNKKAMGIFAKNIGFFTRQLQHKKDLYYSLFIGKDTKNLRANPELVKGKTFQQQILAAEEYGANFVNNEFGIKKAMYNRKIKPNLSKLKNYKKRDSYLYSPEYKDFQLVMDALKDVGADTLFISIPMNARWADFTGINEEKRVAYYEKMNRLLAQSGQTYVDLSSHENDRYFMSDTIHIGWKGWVYVDKAMDDFWYDKK
ncbi:MAG: D-alanyl-lipoteichoic acid biosynthesis protein DltD [Kurthia sp.]|nr:D-alanyl-lipoteichoic acid biosynthesis protein DltD [Candidatus Kurthia equi]